MKAPYPKRLGEVDRIIVNSVQYEMSVTSNSLEPRSVALPGRAPLMIEHIRYEEIGTKSSSLAVSCNIAARREFQKEKRGRAERRGCKQKCILRVRLVHQRQVKFCNLIYHAMCAEWSDV